MENTFAKVEELAGSIKEYTNNRIESVKLGIAEKSSIVIANLVAFLIVAMFFTFFIGFGSMVVAINLGAWTGKMWLGYLIVAGLHFTAGFTIWSFRERLIRFPVMNAMIKQLFQSDEED